MKSESKFSDKKLYRSQSNRMLAGVCGGISEYFEIDPTLIRLIVLSSVFVGGIGLLLYLSALILVPKNPEQKDEQEMRTEFDFKFMIFGFVLVTIGFLLLFKGFPLMKIWSFFWQYAWAVFLIGIGIYLLLYKKGSGPFFNIPIKKSESNKMIGGICAGFADHFQVDVSVVRILWIIGTIITAGVGLLLYIIFMIILPEEPDTEE